MLELYFRQFYGPSTLSHQNDSIRNLNMENVIDVVDGDISFKLFEDLKPLLRLFMTKSSNYACIHLSFINNYSRKTHKIPSIFQSSCDDNSIWSLKISVLRDRHAMTKEYHAPVGLLGNVDDRCHIASKIILPI